MNLHRFYAPTVLCLLAAGGGASLAASRTWMSTTVTSEGLPSDLVVVTGTDAIGWLAALALVVIASALAILAASHRARRMLGVVIVALGIIGTVAVARSGAAIDASLTEAVKASPAFVGASPDVVKETSWRLVTGLAMLIVALLGAVTAVWGARWPTMGQRFDAPSSPRGSVDLESGAELWKALDDGDDPTQ